MINLDYQSRTPIYEQIILEIERYVALGILKPKKILQLNLFAKSFLHKKIIKHYRHSPIVEFQHNKIKNSLSSQKKKRKINKKKILKKRLDILNRK